MCFSSLHSDTKFGDTVPLILTVVKLKNGTLHQLCQNLLGAKDFGAYSQLFATLIRLHFTGSPPAGMGRGQVAFATYYTPAMLPTMTRHLK